MKKYLFCLLLALCFLLTGCGRYAGALPYGREIEDMELIRTLGVDVAPAGVKITASGGDQEETRVVTGEADTISAAVLALQGGGDSYLYFGHVTQLLVGEALAGEGLSPALDYTLRDVEMRLETALYLVQGDAENAIREAAEEGSATERLEALAADAGLTAASMPRTVKDVLADLDRQGASFVPAVTGDGELSAAGYGILKGDTLAGWAQGEAALGVNLIFSKVDADVVTVTAGETTAALRVVGAETGVRPLWDGESLTGLAVTCRVEANLAEGAPMPDEETLAALAAALEEVEESRMERALALAASLDADYLGLRPAAALAVPWRKSALLEEKGMAGLELTARAEATIQRSYHADG